MMLSMVHNHIGAYGEALLGMTLTAEGMCEWEAAENTAVQLVQSLDEASKVGDPDATGSEVTDTWLVRCLNSAGNAARELGRPADAAAMHLRALKLARAMGLGPLVADATQGLGRAMMLVDGEPFESMSQV